MITPKTPGQLRVMEDGGKALGGILVRLLKQAVPGTVLTALEEKAQDAIKDAGGVPSFATVKGYKWATCLCVNDEVVHGIPGAYVLKDGDILTIDIGMLRDGLHTDTAWSVIIGNPAEKKRDPLARFLKTGEDTLKNAIDKARAGNRIWDISEVIEQGIKSKGYDVVVSLVGHGIGSELHEPPQVPGIIRGDRRHSPILVPGMTIAIEVIYAMGMGDVVYANEDGWTIATRDGSVSAVFEHTVGITGGDPLVITHAG